MSVQEDALRFKVWAAEKGIPTYGRPEDLHEHAVGSLADATDVANPASSESPSGKELSRAGGSW